MARESMTLEEIRATRPIADPAKIVATTEADIRRHQIEDGEDPDAPLPPFRRRRMSGLSGRGFK